MRKSIAAVCLIFFSPFLLTAQADIEPSLGDLLPVYLIADIQGAGNVQFLKEGQSEWKDGREGQRLEEGDRIRVGDDTEVVLSLKSKTLVHLDEATELQISQLADNENQGFLSRLKLFTGSILSDVKKNLQETQSSFEVESGGVICGVRGTVFEVSKSGDNVEATTHEGVVDVKTPQGTKHCKAGQTCTTSKGHGSSLRPCTAAMRARFQAWKHAREHLGQKHPQNKEGKSGSTDQMLGHAPSFGGKGAGGPGGGGSVPHGAFGAGRAGGISGGGHR